MDSVQRLTVSEEVISLHLVRDKISFSNWMEDLFICPGSTFLSTGDGQSALVWTNHSSIYTSAVSAYPFCGVTP